MGVFGGRPSVTIGDPNLAREILKKMNEFPKAQLPPQLFLFKKLFGDSSLVRINNPEWHEQRVILNKAFTSNKIFFEPMEKKVLQCVAKWRGGHPVSVEQDLQKMTIDVLATCIFGSDFDTLNGNNSEPLAAYNYCFKKVLDPRVLMFKKYSDLPLQSNIRCKKDMETFDTYCWSIIEQSKKIWKIRKQKKIQNTSLP